MFRSLASIVVLSSCFVQANASDARFAEEGYDVDGGVVVSVPGAVSNLPEPTDTKLGEENLLIKEVSQVNLSEISGDSGVTNESEK